MQAEYVTLSHFNKAIEEIKNLLKNFATKEDVREIVKEEIYALEDRLALSVAKVEDIERLEEKMATKEDLLNLENKIENRYGRQIEILRDDMRLVKTKLKLA